MKVPLPRTTCQCFNISYTFTVLKQPSLNGLFVPLKKIHILKTCLSTDCSLDGPRLAWATR